MSGETALLIGMRITSCTADAFASARQIEAAFEAAIGKISAVRPSFEKIAGIIVCLDLFHPAMNILSRRPSGSFFKIDSNFYCQASIDYPAFASGGWAGRSSAFIDAAVRAVGAIHKTRLSDAELTLVRAYPVDAYTHHI